MLNLTISKHAHLCNFLTAFSAFAWLPKEMQSHRQLPLKPSGQIQPTLTKDMVVSKLRHFCKLGGKEQLGKGPKPSAQHPSPRALCSRQPSQDRAWGESGEIQIFKPGLSSLQDHSSWVYWPEILSKSQEIPEIQARISRSSAILPSLDDQFLTWMPTFLQLLSLQTDNWEKLPAWSGSINWPSIPILNVAWADWKQRACSTAGRETFCFSSTKTRTDDSVPSRG